MDSNCTVIVAAQKKNSPEPLPKNGRESVWNELTSLFRIVIRDAEEVIRLVRE